MTTASGDGASDAVPNTLIAPLACVLAALAADAVAPALFQNFATPVALAAIVVVGLPHGTLDVRAIRASQRLGNRATLIVLALYLALGGAMAVVWWLSPVAALIAFLIVSTIHFAEDWHTDGAAPGRSSREGSSTGRLLSAAAAVVIPLAIFSAGALRDRAAYDTIFTVLTRTAEGTLATDALLAIGPAAQLAALLVIARLASGPRRDLAGAAALSIVAMWLFEPVVGFAIYFAAYHSPIHLRELATVVGGSGRHRVVEAGTTFTLAVLLTLALAGAFEGASGFPSYGSAVFVTLSILTVPHMIAPRLAPLLVPGGATPARSHRPALT